MSYDKLMSLIWLFFFFFFQAEDGIRDIGVTGVQTCALPIWPRVHHASGLPAARDGRGPSRTAGAARGHRGHVDRLAAGLRHLALRGAACDARAASARARSRLRESVDGTRAVRRPRADRSGYRDESAHAAGGA